MSQSDDHDAQQTRTDEMSTWLHNQADQQIDAAERLECRASDTRAEADAMDEEARHMRDRAEHLHQQADQIDRVAEE